MSEETARDQAGEDQPVQARDAQEQPAQEQPTQRPPRSAKLVFTQTVLGLQALAALFAATFVYGMYNAGAVDASPAAIWGLGLWLMVMLGYAAGQQKKSWGVWLGWVLQVPMLLGFFIDSAITIIGAMFVLLWITALRLGGRIDRERAEYNERLAQAEQADGPGATE